MLRLIEIPTPGYDPALFLREVERYALTWDEHKHPRDADGRFSKTAEHVAAEGKLAEASAKLASTGASPAPSGDRSPAYQEWQKSLTPEQRAAADEHRSAAYKVQRHEEDREHAEKMVAAINESLKSGEQRWSGYERTKVRRLTPEEKAAIVARPEFQRWFQGSQVLDQDGTPQENYSAPKLAFHGTKQGGWNTLDPSKADANALYGAGFYFTEDADIAADYAEVPEPMEERLSWHAAKMMNFAMQQYRQSDRSIQIGSETLQAQHDYNNVPHYLSRVMGKDVAPEGIKMASEIAKSVSNLPNQGREVKSVFLNIRKPFDIDTHKLTPEQVSLPDAVKQAAGGQAKTFEEWRTLALNASRNDDNAPNPAQTLRMDVERAGYDGMTHIGGKRMGRHDHRVWIAFQPNQAKSVDSKNFDPNDNRMDYARAAGEAFREYYERWITIGGKEDGEKKHAGGTPVKIDGAGRIEAGPAALKGKPLAQVDQNKQGAGAKETGGQAERHRDELHNAVSSAFKLEGTPEGRSGAQKNFLGDVGALPKAPPQPKRGPAQLKVSDIKADPSRFQYKISGIDPKTGVTKELHGAAYNPLFGGQLLVWHDPKDGQTYVINGHHRHDLAKRSNYNGNMSAYYIDAKTPEEARAIGALANIAGGKGTAIDAAKFMRDTGTSPEEMQQHGITLSGKIANDGTTLAKLHPDLFQALTEGRMDEGRALAIARHVDKPEFQKTLHTAIAKREEKSGKAIPHNVVEELAREMALAGSRKEKGNDLFGDFEDEKSNFFERGEIKAHVRKQLGEEKNAFRAVSNKKRVGRLADAGNQLDVEGNASRARSAGEALGVFDKLANSKGVISDAINEAAAAYGSNPKSRRQIFADAYKRVLAAINAESGGVESPETYARAEGADVRARGGSAKGGDVERLTEYADRQFANHSGARAMNADQLRELVAREVNGHVERYALQFDESKHKRDSDGKFARMESAQAAMKGKKAHEVPASVHADAQGKFEGPERDAVFSLHRNAVIRAAKSGKNVPDEVLAEHGDLAKLAGVKPAGGGEPFALKNKPEKPAPQKFENLGGKQGALFGKSGLPGQKNLFADDGVPDDLVGAAQKQGGQPTSTGGPPVDDMATAIARGDDVEPYAEQYAEQAKAAGMDPTAAADHVQAALSKAFGAVNASHKETQGRYSSDGGKTYTPERKALHDRIIGLAIGHGKPQEKPECHFLGGGAASGKSTITNSGMVKFPEGAVKIDPDEIKGSLPEYQMSEKLRDYRCAATNHEESSDISKTATAAAYQNRFHTIIDGVGNSGYDKMAEKVQKARAAGLSVRAHYVTCDTDEAVRRAKARALKKGREVPEHALRGGHKSVSQIVPRAIQEGLFDAIDVYDTNGGEGVPPLKIASAVGNQLTVHHPEAWERFLAKGRDDAPASAPKPA